MAGVRFAELATDPDNAEAFQKLIAQNGSERLFFPPLDGLPRDMNKQQFVDTFGHVDSPEYQRAVDDIEVRLEKLQVNQMGD